MNMARPPKDRDFIETTDGFFSCVVGYLHPRDKIISYVKYIPNAGGKWGRRERRYKRFLGAYTIPHLADNINELGDKYPQYVFYSDVLNTTMSCCPLNFVRRLLHPEVKLQRLRLTQKRDPLQERVISLVSLLSKESGISHRFFGVTGSILIDIHQPDFSDIDLTVYGRENSLKVKEAALNLYRSNRSPLRRLRGAVLDRWCEEKAKDFPITGEEARTIYERTWNRGVFGKTLFSIHPVRLDEEITETYGDRIFIPEGMAEIEAIISETDEAVFLPCTYGVETISVHKGEANITEITTYQGFYGDIVEEGETVAARGKLERVIDRRSGHEHYRLFIGSVDAQGRDYIKPQQVRKV